MESLILSDLFEVLTVLPPRLWPRAVRGESGVHLQGWIVDQAEFAVCFCRCFVLITLWFWRRRRCFPETSDFSEFHYVATHNTALMPLCSHHLTTGSCVLLQTLNWPEVAYWYKHWTVILRSKDRVQDSTHYGSPSIWATPCQLVGWLMTDCKEADFGYWLLDRRDWGKSRNFRR